MALGFTSKAASYDPENRSSYTLSSVSYVGGRDYFLFILSFHTTGLAEVPSVSGPGGLTWTYVGDTTSGTNSLSVFRCRPGSNVTGAAVATLGITHQGMRWSIVEVTGASASPVVAVVSNSGSNDLAANIQMAPFGAGTNHALAAIIHHVVEAITPGSGFTELSDDAALMQPTTAPRSMQVQHKVNDPTVDWSWATSATWRAISVEIADGAGGGSAQTVEVPQLLLAPTVHAPSIVGGAVNPSVFVLDSDTRQDNTTDYQSNVIETTLGTVLYLAVGAYSAGGVAAAPASVSGPGTLAWTKIGEQSGGSSYLSLWEAKPGAIVSGAIDIAFGASMSGIEYVLTQVTNAQVAAPTVQVVPEIVSSGATTLLATLAALQNATNLVLGFLLRDASGDNTPGAGFTELVDLSDTLDPPSSGPRSMQAQWSQNDPSVDWTWTGASSARALALEVAVEAAATQQVAVPLLSLAPTVYAPRVQQPGTTTDWQWGVFPMCGGGGCNAIDVSPYDASRVLTWGDLAGPIYTDDGGLNWDLCRGGLNDQSPQHTGGGVTWSRDATKPNRIWAITSGGIFVSNTWPPRWLPVNTSIGYGGHGSGPRPVGSNPADTGTGILYFCTETQVYRYNVAGANGDTGTFTLIASGLTGANAVVFDPNDISRVWVATASGVHEITSADTRTSPASSAVSGLSGQTWDLSIEAEGGTTFLYVASDTNKVRRYNTTTGTVQSIGASLPSGQYMSIVTRRSGGVTFCAVACTSSVQSGGFFQQWFTTPDAAQASPTWTCVTLDNGAMNLVETEGPGGEAWIGYLAPAAGGNFGNRLRDESTYRAHDSALSADGRYLFAASTGGVYRFDFQLLTAYPVMHRMGTTTNAMVRTHPSDAGFAVTPNTDHGALYTVNSGDRWLKNERWAGSGPSAFPGSTEGTYAAFDPGASRAVFLGVGDRGVNSGGVVVYTPNIETTGWDTLGLPATQHPGAMDARRIGSTLYLFVALLNGGIRRYSAPVSNIFAGSWVTCSGLAFSSGGTALQCGDVRWVKDDVVLALDKSRGLFRCTNPTAATPTWELIWAVTNDSERECFMDVDETLPGRLFVSSDGSPEGLFRITGALAGAVVVTEINKVGGSPFVRPGPLAVHGGIVYCSEVKDNAGADAAVYSGAVTVDTLTDDLTDTWIAENMSKQTYMQVNADDTRILVSGRGGGVWGATRGLAAAPDQVIGVPLLALAPVVHAPSVEVGAGGVMTIEVPLLSLAPTVFSPSVAQGGSPPQAIGVPMLTLAPTVYQPAVVRASDPQSLAASPSRLRKTRRFPPP